MEIGATVCRPKGPPKCSDCPLKEKCAALALHHARDIPAIEGIIPEKKNRATKKIVSVAVAVHYFVNDGEFMYSVVQRSSRGLLAGMVDFPQVELRNSESDALKCVQSLAFGGKGRLLGTVRHVFSHIDMSLHVIGFRRRKAEELAKVASENHATVVSASQLQIRNDPNFVASGRHVLKVVEMVQSSCGKRHRDA
jgi:A/G-specific adenine glycosylase